MLCVKLWNFLHTQAECQMGNSFKRGMIVIFLIPSKYLLLLNYRRNFDIIKDAFMYMKYYQIVYSIRELLCTEFSSFKIH